MAILYLTTNKIDGKKYIGVDGKNNPDYLGSGKYLKRAILKYGRENFTKEILFEFDSETDAYLKEIEIIHELNAVESKEYYNIHPGGDGGWGHMDVSGNKNPMYGKNVRDIFIANHGNDEGNRLYDETRTKAGKKTSEMLKGRSKTEDHKRKLSESKKNFWSNLTESDKQEWRNSMSDCMKSAGIKRSDSYKEKMSEILKKKASSIHRIEKCNVCGKEMSIQNINRWHGEKCKGLK